jgi:hypothetical protein
VRLPTSAKADIDAVQEKVVILTLSEAERENNPVFRLASVAACSFVPYTKSNLRQETSAI